MGTIQIKALRFALNLSWGTSYDIVIKCANASTIKDRIKDFPKLGIKTQ